MNGNKFHIAGDDYYHGRNGKEQDEGSEGAGEADGPELPDIQ
jgi:hypothetical protein